MSKRIWVAELVCFNYYSSIFKYPLANTLLPVPGALQILAFVVVAAGTEKIPLPVCSCVYEHVEQVVYWGINTSRSSSRPLVLQR